jgi:UDP-N-acetylmuramoyl-L-alanyl-D-glutamate--2,6-diaminopimelate ligase
MNIADLLKNIAETELDVEINGLAIDSRQVRPGNLFIALHGVNQHGVIHADQAIAQGAKAIIYDPAGMPNADAPVVSIPAMALADLDKHLGAIAAKFYGNPSQNLTVIGITGTNGKTTCSQLIAQAVPDCGVIGTLGWGVPENLLPTINTTPDALSIQQMLAQLADWNKRTVAMEVSSHGLQQGRVNAVKFTGAVFTNLSRDHLDYHGNIEDYFQAKLLLFRQTDLQFAVLNADDSSVLSVRNALANNVQCWTFSAKGERLTGTQSIWAEDVKFSNAGIRFQAVWGDQKSAVFTPLVGEFNLENILAVLTVLLAAGMSFSDAVARLGRLQAITGRMEKFGGADKPTVFVDYAHSPDALEKVLKAARNRGRLWVVFGCGGNRDKGKRKDMGRIAERLADKVIITDDNPRHESAQEIIDDILAGCQSRNVTVINDRRLAINTAIKQAAKDDCVLIAGKGHESYQEINGMKLPFCDQAVVKQSLASWNN